MSSSLHTQEGVRTTRCPQPQRRDAAASMGGSSVRVRAILESSGLHWRAGQAALYLARTAAMVSGVQYHDVGGGKLILASAACAVGCPTYRRLTDRRREHARRHPPYFSTLWRESAPLSRNSAARHASTAHSADSAPPLAGSLPLRLLQDPTRRLADVRAAPRGMVGRYRGTRYSYCTSTPRYARVRPSSVFGVRTGKSRLTAQFDSLVLTHWS